MTINERIRELRKSYLHLNQTEFAKKLGLAQTGVSYMEQYGSTIADSTIKTICAVFDINEDWLRNGTEPMYMNRYHYSSSKTLRQHGTGSWSSITEDAPKMKARFHMTREQNIFWAKRNIIDYIWKSAKLEGLGVTYPDTEAIFNGMSVSGVKVDDIVAVNNLKHAWQFLLDNLDYPIDFPYICHINRLVGEGLYSNAGWIRNLPVSIGGTNWKPDMPIESVIKEELSDVLQADEPTDRAITLMLYTMRKQMFLDGNKRTAMLAANQVMISSGCGIISVPVELQRDFTIMLIDYYESGDMRQIKKFVYNQCIDGADMPLERTDADYEKKASSFLERLNHAKEEAAFQQRLRSFSSDKNEQIR